MTRGVVYMGPSLPSAARSASRIEYRRPIRRGDLAALTKEEPRATHVGIVDGEFHQSLAVSPREILALMRLGVIVYGSSSMGALRGAELHALGMVGVGRIFAMYRDGEVVSDDEVALIFDADSERTLSEPLVNVRCSVAAARDRGAITSECAEAIIEAARSLHYTGRSYRTILRLAGEQLRTDLGTSLEMLASHDQKRLDAIELCDRMLADVIGSA